MAKTRGSGLLMLWTDSVYEFERADIPDSEAWHRARESSPWSRRIRPHMRLDPGSPAVYRRIRPDPVP